MVSVWMITYNHEKFIGKAIESVLSQKTNFTFELVIGEDNSNDDTAKIIKEYHSKYPDIIKPIYHTANKGMMGNMIDTLNRCKGKYVAMLECDDFWTYEYKLQQQVDFLESNPEVSFCFHNAEVCYENNSRPNHVFAEINEGYYSGNQIIEHWIVPTASVVFRNTNLNMPNFAKQCAHGDLLLFLLLLETGKAYALKETWSVYRKNDQSITNSNTLNPIFIQKVIDQNRNMNSFFKNKYYKAFSFQKKYWRLALLKSLWVNRKLNRFVWESVIFNLNFPFYFIKTYLLRLK